MTNNNVLPATLSALLRDYSVAEGIQMAEQQVSKHPAQASRRHSLFQLLCVTGDWSQALQQIQLCARMDANYTREAQIYGELIRCEIYRHACFQGNSGPVLFSRRPHGWRICWPPSPVTPVVKRRKLIPTAAARLRP